MYRNIFILLLVLIFATSVFAAEYTSTEGDLKVSANILQLGKKAVKAKNKITVVANINDNTKITIKCNLLQLNASEEGATSINNLKDLVFKNNVIVRYDYTEKDGTKATCLAKSDEGYYDGKSQILILTGNVNIEYVNGNGVKMTAKGKKTVINFKENPNEDEPIFTIEGDMDSKAKVSGDLLSEL